MRPAVRWPLTLAAVAASFVLAGWFAYWAVGRLVPKISESDRWVIAMAFATALAAAVMMWAGWWAAREPRQRTKDLPASEQQTPEPTDEQGGEPGRVTAPERSTYTANARIITGLQQGDGNSQTITDA